MPRKPSCNCDFDPIIVETNVGDAKIKAVEKKIKMGRDFVTTVPVGHMEAGTIIGKDDLVSDILYKILFGGEEKVLISIAISVPPIKTEYTVGQPFDPTGMVVTATFEDGDVKVVTGYNYVPSGPLELGVTNIVVRYSSGGIIKTANQAITVSAPSQDVIIRKGAAGNGATFTEPVASEFASLESQTIQIANLLGKHCYTGIICADKYPCFAVPAGYKIVSWNDDEAGAFTAGFNLVPGVENYNMYYTDNPRTDLSGTQENWITVERE